MRIFLPILAATALLPATPIFAQQDAASYPNRPVKIIVNVAPGGGIDTTTRLIAAKLEQRLGQTFVIENRGGAGGNIGAEAVYTAEPDGYTLLASSGSPLAINGWLYKKLNYDPEGFLPIAMMSRIPNVLVVRSAFPANTVREFIDHAKANPGKLTYASQGTGTASHLTAELFMTRTQTKLVHVPYKGTSPALNDIIAGHVDLSFIQFSSAYELHGAGKARILAVATGKRIDAMPGMPTLAETGVPGIVSETWNALSAPPKTPAAIVSKLNQAINEALGSSDMLARFRELQLLPGGGNTDETARFIAAERRQWGEVVRAAGLVPQ
jgi:tripartite-type tricarboxylate transporter receptor subunit TctC